MLFIPVHVIYTSTCDLYLLLTRAFLLINSTCLILFSPGILRSLLFECYLYHTVLDITSINSMLYGSSYWYDQHLLRPLAVTPFCFCYGWSYTIYCNACFWQEGFCSRPSRPRAKTETNAKEKTILRSRLHACSLGD